MQGLLEKAMVDVYEGNLSLEKAAAIVSLANQYYRNEKKMTLEIPCEEVGDFAALVAALWAKDALREWTSREVRKVALEEESIRREAKVIIAISAAFKIVRAQFFLGHACLFQSTSRN